MPFDPLNALCYKFQTTDAGWSSLVARRAHNPKVAGSNPAPATIYKKKLHCHIEHIFLWNKMDLKRVSGLNDLRGRSGRTKN